jgi:ATP/maltotriose-dependent transcriptional regulator MalT
MAKTTLVASYFYAHSLLCIWYNFDEGDNDLATFFYYMGQAAKRAVFRRKISLPLLEQNQGWCSLIRTAAGRRSLLVAST